MDGNPQFKVPFFSGFITAKHSPDEQGLPGKDLKNNPTAQGTEQSKFHNCSTGVNTATQRKKFSIFKLEK